MTFFDLNQRWIVHSTSFSNVRFFEELKKYSLFTPQPQYKYHDQFAKQILVGLQYRLSLLHINAKMLAYYGIFY